jgi:hypothetical protein
MKIYLYLISFVLYYYNGQTAQPYFPPQIVFSPDDDEIIVAIDEINQRAYTTYPVTSSLTVFAYVLKHFPYAPSDVIIPLRWVSLLKQMRSSSED